jgi:hypothetical protein
MIDALTLLCCVAFAVANAAAAAAAAAIPAIPAIPDAVLDDILGFLGSRLVCCISDFYESAHLADSGRFVVMVHAVCCHKQRLDSTYRGATRRGTTRCDATRRA